MAVNRSLSKELFGGHADTVPPHKVAEPCREISLSEVAELSELTEEQAKIRVKVTHIAAKIEAIATSVESDEQRIERLRVAFRGAVSQVEQLSKADDLHGQQLGQVSDGLRQIDSQIEAQKNAIAYLRNSDGQQQQDISRLKQSRITLTHVLLFGILLCAGGAFALDVDAAFNVGYRLNQIENRIYP